MNLFKSNHPDCPFLRTLIPRIIRDNKKLEISEKTSARTSKKLNTTLYDDENKKPQLFKITRNKKNYAKDNRN